MTHTADAAGAPDTAPRRSTGAAPGVFPPGRYGRRREPVTRSRWIMPVALVVVVVLCAALAVKLYKQYGTAQFTPTVITMSDVSDTSVTVRFLVRKADAASAVCTLDALAVDDSIVGTAQVPVPAGRSVTVTFTLTTTYRAYVAEVPSCRAA